MTEYYVYIIEAMRTSKQNYGHIIYYTGYSSNPKRRLFEHKNYFSSNINWMQKNRIIARKFVYIEHVKTLNQAKKRETQIKRYSKKKKEELINKYNLK